MTTGGTEVVDRPDRRPGLAPGGVRQAGVERLDRAIVVTRTRAWIGLAAALVLVVGVVLWAALAEVDQTVSAPGVALRNGTLVQVVAPVSGTVVALYAAEGDHIQMGEPIALMQTADGHNAAVDARLSGTIVQILGQVGVTVGAGTSIYRVAQASGPVIVRTFLPVSQAKLLSLGDRAQVQVAGGPTVSGRVSYISSVPIAVATLGTVIGDPALADNIARVSEGISVWVRPAGSWSRHLSSVAFAQVTFVYQQRHPIDDVF